MNSQYARLEKGLTTRREKALKAIEAQNNIARNAIMEIEERHARRIEAHELEIEVVNNMLKQLERLSEPKPEEPLAGTKAEDRQLPKTK